MTTPISKRTRSERSSGSTLSPEKSFNDVLDSIDKKLSSLDARLALVEILHQEFQKLRESLEYSQEQVVSLAAENQALRDNVKQLTDGMTQLSGENKKIKESILEIQARSMRDNLVFCGIAERAEEDVETSVREFIQHQLKLPTETKLAAECQSAGYTGTLIPYKCDLCNEEEILSMFSAIKTLHQGVDVCINNAGLSHSEPLLSGRTNCWKNMLDVNVLALAICTREAYQSMKERNVDDGHIININSMAGHRITSTADSHFYCATKYAVTAFTEGLRQELREAKTHIRATCISPGTVETEFAFRHHNSDPEKAASVYESIKCLTAEDVANAVTYVLGAPPHVQIGDVQMRPVEQVL